MRRTLRTARESQDGPNEGMKLEAIRLAAADSFPTADVEQMLAEIEQGYDDRG